MRSLTVSDLPFAAALCSAEFPWVFLCKKRVSEGFRSPVGCRFAHRGDLALCRADISRTHHANLISECAFLHGYHFSTCASPLCTSSLRFIPALHPCTSSQHRNKTQNAPFISARSTCMMSVHCLHCSDPPILSKTWQTFLLGCCGATHLHSAVPHSADPSATAFSGLPLNKNSLVVEVRSSS